MRTITDLDGKELKWKFGGRVVDRATRPCSSLHEKARELVIELFPTFHVLEEVSVPIRRGKTLRFDFFVPLFFWAIEVNGSQHFQYSNLFHKSKMDFFKQAKNDSDKREWAELNGIRITELNYDEDQDEWRRKLRNANGQGTTDSSGKTT